MVAATICLSYTGDMFANLVQHWQDQLDVTVLGGTPWLRWFVDNLIDLLTSPLTGLRTRSYWPELLAALLIAAALFAIRIPRAERGLRNFLKFCFPASQWRHRSTWVDWQIIVLNQFFAKSFNLTWRFNTALVTTWVVAHMTRAFGPGPHLLVWNTPALVAYTILIAVADDFSYYVFHLASHRIPWFWAFHKVHHSAETLQVFANVRTHPMEYCIGGPIKAVIMPIILAPAIYFGTGNATTIQILGMDLTAVLWCVLGTQLHHSHVWLSWGRVLNHVLISPSMHQVHHSSAPRHWNRNLGANIALWDWIFGTIYVPHGYEELSFGLGAGQKQPYNNGLEAYFRPFWDITPNWGKAIVRTELARLRSLLPGRPASPPVSTQILAPASSNAIEASPR